METQKLISDILEGKTSVLSFDNVAFGPEKDVAADVLSALNFTRLAFVAVGSTPVLSQILAQLCSKKTVDDALAICREWPSGVHLQVEDVYHIPLFEASLKLVSTDFDSPNSDHIVTLLENLRDLGSPAALLMTRYPDVIACVRLRTSTQEVFVVFSPRVNSDGPQVAGLTFSTSLPQIAQRLCDMFVLDDIHIAQSNHDRQLHEKYTVHMFVPRATSYDAPSGEESLIASSLTLLSLRAELEQLTRNNGSLKKEKKRLERSFADITAQLEEDKAKAKRSQSSKSTVVPMARSGTVVFGRGSQLNQPSRSTKEPKHFLDVDDMDPDIQFALRLQATFDSENDSLLKQKHALMQTAQRQCHCGICLDDFPEDDVVHIDACEHEICRDCARGHVCSKIEEHRFPVLCPVCLVDNKNQNPGTIPGTLVQLLGVSEQQWATWVEMEIAQFSIPINCRKCHHSGFVDRQDLESSSEIHCPFPVCDHVWCKKCQQTIEPGGPEHSCDGTSELDHLMKQQGWRYCPNCKTPIQKLQGCNHLSCIAPGCNTHFCYRCGETINRTAIPCEIQEGKTAHFRSCSLF